MTVQWDNLPMHQMDKQYFAVSMPSHRSEPSKAVRDITGNEEME